MSLGNRSTFLLLTAPAGWGKTYLLFENYFRKPSLWLYLSPLRALAEEMEASCRKQKIPCFREPSKFKNQGFWICTPESLRDEWLELFAGKLSGVIYDEFHLFYDWGLSFRPRMQEIFFLVSSLGINSLALSASMGAELIKGLKNDLEWSEYYFHHLSFGDLVLQNEPSIRFLVSSYKQKRILRFLLLQTKEDFLLIFCRYRAEVEAWSDFCCRHKISHLAIVGGEAQKIGERIKKENPRVIVSTEALSHGVNLPIRRWVFLTYIETRERFFLQMQGRGGRDGGEFYFVASNLMGVSLRDKWLGIAKGVILDFLCYNNLCAHILREFFLKRSLFKKDTL